MTTLMIPGNITQVRQPKSAGTKVGPFSMTIEAWMPSKIRAVSPFVDRVMRLIEESGCFVGDVLGVELALREALNNAVTHGNANAPNKLVEVRCRCERGNGVRLTVKDQGKGFDPNAVPDPLAPDRLEAVHGRGIYLMRSTMDEVSFEAGGTVVRMWKRANAQA